MRVFRKNSYHSFSQTTSIRCLCYMSYMIHFEGDVDTSSVSKKTSFVGSTSSASVLKFNTNVSKDGDEESKVTGSDSDGGSSGSQSVGVMFGAPRVGAVHSALFEDIPYGVR